METQEPLFVKKGLGSHAPSKSSYVDELVEKVESLIIFARKNESSAFTSTMEANTTSPPIKMRSLRKRKDVIKASGGVLCVGLQVAPLSIVLAEIITMDLDDGSEEETLTRIQLVASPIRTTTSAKSEALFCESGLVDL
ncbi:hypothetical protein HAX54_040261 [Datura stramonium]|uniref:Uncharacterized protein n=1 Tax=Datura stramonium TaxID=4076 RepID=A0ABS8VMD8_DATST|nr:hypothetical protein [Datura stramonium]